MLDHCVWNGESSNVCTSCGSLFSGKVLVEAVVSGAARWRSGSPQGLGDYWVTFSSNVKLPVRAQVWSKQGIEMLTFEGRHAPLNEVRERITHHQMLVRPCPPGGYVVVGCTGSD